MYGEHVDVDAFLGRCLLARVATRGPTVRPVWFIWEEGSFWWLTDTKNVLAKSVTAGEAIALVVDVCDVDTGEVVHVFARGLAAIVPVDIDRAKRKFARYLGPDEGAWDPRFVASLSVPTTRMIRFTPEQLRASDVSFLVQRKRQDEGAASTRCSTRPRSSLRSDRGR